MDGRPGSDCSLLPKGYNLRRTKNALVFDWIQLFSEHNLYKFLEVLEQILSLNIPLKGSLLIGLHVKMVDLIGHVNLSYFLFPCDVQKEVQNFRVFVRLFLARRELKLPGRPSDFVCRAGATDLQLSNVIPFIWIQNKCKQ